VGKHNEFEKNEEIKDGENTVNDVDITSLVNDDNETSESKKDANNEKEKEVGNNSENKKKHKFFKPYKIKDIVFLAIITACTLVFGAIMPLLIIFLFLE